MSTFTHLFTPERRTDLIEWMLNALQVGVIIVNQDERIVMLNQWVSERSGVKAANAIDCLLTEVFPEIKGQRVELAVKQALKNNFPSIISNSLNTSPFHLSNKKQPPGEAQSIQQAIQVLPAHSLGQPLVLIQILDVTPSARREQLLRVQADELRQFSNTDGLTGIANRRRFAEYFEAEISRAQRTGRTISLVMMDVDFFKRYNDQHGHLGGDKCLIRVVQEALLAIKRPADLLARYGGEEFALILPETESAGAYALAEEIRKRIEIMRMDDIAQEGGSGITLSLGITSSRLGTELSPIQLITQADMALYKAKADGRNRSYVFTEALHGPDTSIREY